MNAPRHQHDVKTEACRHQVRQHAGRLALEHHALELGNGVAAPELAERTLLSGRGAVGVFAREQRFVDSLSQRSRYLRFQHHLPQLTPAMLERFTQLDYDRELALVAVDPASGEFLGVGRYAPNADGTSAEFALTIADTWQRKGIGGVLLERLCTSARAAGYGELVGYVLAENRDMLALAEHLGFVHRARDGDAAVVVRRLD